MSSERDEREREASLTAVRRPAGVPTRMCGSRSRTALRVSDVAFWDRFTCPGNKGVLVNQMGA